MDDGNRPSEIQIPRDTSYPKPVFVGTATKSLWQQANEASQSNEGYAASVNYNPQTIVPVGHEQPNIPQTLPQQVLAGMTHEQIQKYITSGEAPQQEMYLPPNTQDPKVPDTRPTAPSVTPADVPLEQQLEAEYEQQLEQEFQQFQAPQAIVDEGFVNKLNEQFGDEAADVIAKLNAAMGMPVEQVQALFQQAQQRQQDIELAQIIGGNPVSEEFRINKQKLVAAYQQIPEHKRAAYDTVAGIKALWNVVSRGSGQRQVQQSSTVTPTMPTTPTVTPQQKVITNPGDPNYGSAANQQALINYYANGGR